jgi:hypothetical protein
MVFKFSKCSSEEMSLLHIFPCSLDENIREKEHCLGTHLLNFFSVLVASYWFTRLKSWFLEVHSSSYNMFLKIAKRLFKGLGEKVKSVCDSRILIVEIL